MSEYAAPEHSLYHNGDIRQGNIPHITPAFHFPNEGGSDYLPAGTGMSPPACRTDSLLRITASHRLRQRPDLGVHFKDRAYFISPGQFYPGSIWQALLQHWAVLSTLLRSDGPRHFGQPWMFCPLFRLKYLGSRGKDYRDICFCNSSKRRFFPALVPSSRHFP